MNRLPLHPFPQLATARLRLRRLRASDAPEIYRLRADDRVNEFIDRPKAINLQDALAYIDKIHNGVEAGDWVYWAILFQEQKKLIGTICLWNVSAAEKKAELGYELMPDYQGQGIMQEAVGAVLDFGFRTLKLRSIEAVSRPANHRSIKLLEKFGFQLSGTLKETSAESSASPAVVYTVRSS